MKLPKTHRPSRNGRVLAELSVVAGCMACVLYTLWSSNSLPSPTLSLSQIAILIVLFQFALAAVVLILTGWSREVGRSNARPRSDEEHANRWLASGRRSGRQRRGAVALEFAVVAMIFLISILGIVELSRAIMVHQVLVNAAREGTRRAVVPGAKDEDLTGSDGVITKYLEAAGIPADSTAKIYVNKTEASLSTASSFDEITVTVSVPFQDASWGLLRYFPTDATMTSAVVMRKE